MGIVATAKTPWEQFVTEKPELFGFAGQDSAFLVTAGSRRAFCLFNSKTNVIRQDGSGGDGVQVEPYQLRLSGWTDTAPPILQAHPFLVPHLLATGQVGKSELLERVAKAGQGAVRMTIVIAQPCALLNTMNLRRCALMLSTNFNLAWGKVM
jgi:hypothetical protein